MTEVGTLKWIEVGVLVLAGGIFVWWQLRDVRLARQQSRRQDHADQADAANAPNTPTATDSKEGPRP